MTLTAEIRIAKSIFFPVVVCGRQSWTLRKAEYGIWYGAFELWYWRRILGVPWTTKRTNQSILEQINPDYSMKSRLLQLKLDTLDI